MILNDHRRRNFLMSFVIVTIVVLLYSLTISNVMITDVSAGGAGGPAPHPQQSHVSSPLNTVRGRPQQPHQQHPLVTTAHAATSRYKDEVALTKEDMAEMRAAETRLQRLLRVIPDKWAVVAPERRGELGLPALNEATEKAINEAVERQKKELDKYGHVAGAHGETVDDILEGTQEAYRQAAINKLEQQELNSVLEHLTSAEFEAIVKQAEKLKIPRLVILHVFRRLKEADNSEGGTKSGFWSWSGVGGGKQQQQQQHFEPISVQIRRMFTQFADLEQRTRAFAVKTGETVQLVDLLMLFKTLIPVVDEKYREPLMHTIFEEEPRLSNLEQLLRAPTFVDHLACLWREESEELPKKVEEPVQKKPVPAPTVPAYPRKKTGAITIREAPKPTTEEVSEEMEEDEEPVRNHLDTVLAGVGGDHHHQQKTNRKSAANSVDSSRQHTIAIELLRVYTTVREFVKTPGLTRWWKDWLNTMVVGWSDEQRKHFFTVVQQSGFKDWDSELKPILGDSFPQLIQSTWALVFEILETDKHIQATNREPTTVWREHHKRFVKIQEFAAEEQQEELDAELRRLQHAQTLAHVLPELRKVCPEFGLGHPLFPELLTMLERTEPKTRRELFGRDSGAPGAPGSHSSAGAGLDWAKMHEQALLSMGESRDEAVSRHHQHLLGELKVEQQHDALKAAAVKKGKKYEKPEEKPEAQTSWQTGELTQAANFFVTGYAHTLNSEAFSALLKHDKQQHSDKGVAVLVAQKFYRALWRRLSSEDGGATFARPALVAGAILDLGHVTPAEAAHIKPEDFVLVSQVVPHQSVSNAQQKKPEKAEMSLFERLQTVHWTAPGRVLKAIGAIRAIGFDADERLGEDGVGAFFALPEAESAKIGRELGTALSEMSHAWWWLRGVHTDALLDKLFPKTLLERLSVLGERYRAQEVGMLDTVFRKGARIADLVSLDEQLTEKHQMFLMAVQTYTTVLESAVGTLRTLPRVLNASCLWASKRAPNTPAEFPKTTTNHQKGGKQEGQNNQPKSTLKFTAVAYCNGGGNSCRSKEGEAVDAKKMSPGASVSGTKPVPPDPKEADNKKSGQSSAAPSWPYGASYGQKTKESSPLNNADELSNVVAIVDQFVVGYWEPKHCAYMLHLIDSVCSTKKGDAGGGGAQMLQGILSIDDTLREKQQKPNQAVSAVLSTLGTSLPYTSATQSELLHKISASEYHAAEEKNVQFWSKVLPLIAETQISADKMRWLSTVENPALWERTELMLSRYDAMRTMYGGEVRHTPTVYLLCGLDLTQTNRLMGAARDVRKAFEELGAKTRQRYISAASMKPAEEVVVNLLKALFSDELAGKIARYGLKHGAKYDIPRDKVTNRMGPAPGHEHPAQKQGGDEDANRDALFGRLRAVYVQWLLDVLGLLRELISVERFPLESFSVPGTPTATNPHPEPVDLFPKLVDQIIVVFWNTKMRRKAVAMVLGACKKARLSGPTLLELFAIERYFARDLRQHEPKTVFREIINSLDGRKMQYTGVLSPEQLLKLGDRLTAIEGGGHQPITQETAASEQALTEFWHSWLLLATMNGIRSHDVTWLAKFLRDEGGTDGDSSVMEWAKNPSLLLERYNELIKNYGKEGSAIAVVESYEEYKSSEEGNAETTFSLFMRLSDPEVKQLLDRVKTLQLECGRRWPRTPLSSVLRDLFGDRTVAALVKLFARQHRQLSAQPSINKNRTKRSKKPSTQQEESKKIDHEAAYLAGREFFMEYLNGGLDGLLQLVRNIPESIVTYSGLDVTEKNLVKLVNQLVLAFWNGEKRKDTLELIAGHIRRGTLQQGGFNSLMESDERNMNFSLKGIYPHTPRTTLRSVLTAAEKQSSGVEIKTNEQFELSLKLLQHKAIRQELGNIRDEIAIQFWTQTLAMLDAFAKGQLKKELVAPKQTTHKMFEVTLDELKEFLTPSAQCNNPFFLNKKHEGLPVKPGALFVDLLKAFHDDTWKDEHLQRQGRAMLKQALSQGFIQEPPIYGSIPNTSQQTSFGIWDKYKVSGSDKVLLAHARVVLCYDFAHLLRNGYTLAGVDYRTECLGQVKDEFRAFYANVQSAEIWNFVHHNVYNDVIEGVMSATAEHSEIRVNLYTPPPQKSEPVLQHQPSSVGGGHRGVGGGGGAGFPPGAPPREQKEKKEKGRGFGIGRLLSIGGGGGNNGGSDSARRLLEDNKRQQSYSSSYSNVHDQQPQQQHHQEIYDPYHPIEGLHGSDPYGFNQQNKSFQK